MEDLSTAIGLATKQFLRDNVFGPIPGKIVSVDEYESMNVVDVEVTVPRVFSSGRVEREEGQIIGGVPIVQPGAGEAVTTYPVKVRDPVLLIPCMRDITEWKLSSGEEESNPREIRYMSKNDFVAIVGLETTKSHLNPHPDNFEIKFNDFLLSVSPDGGYIIKNGNFQKEVTPQGDMTITQPGSTFTITAAGDFTFSNGPATINAAPGGTITLNGVTISPQGAITSPTSITSPNMTAQSSMTVAGKEQAGHTHNYTDDGNPRVTEGNN